MSLYLVTGILALAACGDPGGEGPGVRGTLVAEEAVPDTVQLELERYLGGHGGDQFGSVRGIAVDGAARVWVLDGKDRTIRIYGHDGEYRRTIGRRGGGPGELEQPAALLTLEDGRLLLDDPGNTRLVVLDTSGNVLANHVVASYCAQAQPWPASLDLRGRYVAVGGVNCDLVVRWDTTFAEDVRVAAPRDPRPPQEIRAPWGSVTPPFAPEVLWQPAADTSIWALQTDTYRLSRLTLRGDTIRSALVRFERARLSSADLAMADQFLSELRGEGVVVDRSVLPSHKPAAVSFFVAPDGALWVERYTEPDDLGHRWDVVDSATLSVRAVVWSPVPISRFPVPRLHRDRVIAATIDSLGAPQVVVLRRR